VTVTLAAGAALAGASALELQGMHSDGDKLLDENATRSDA
jgi:hypothetical protein